jgi:hypothetical protein
MTSENKDDTFQPLGKHSVCIEGDTIWLRQRGTVDLVEMVELCRLLSEQGDRYGYVLYLGDAQHGEIATAAARRYQAQNQLRRADPYHAATYGAGAVVTTLAHLTLRAVELISRTPNSISFHKDEAAARERLDRERLVLQAKVRR